MTKSTASLGHSHHPEMGSQQQRPALGPTAAPRDGQTRWNPGLQSSPRDGQAQQSPDLGSTAVPRGREGLQLATPMELAFHRGQMVQALRRQTLAKLVAVQAQQRTLAAGCLCNLGWSPDQSKKSDICCCHLPGPSWAHFWLHLHL